MEAEVCVRRYALLVVHARQAEDQLQCQTTNNGQDATSKVVLW